MSINRSISMANDAPDEVLIKAMRDPASSHIPQPIAYQELINRQRMRLAQKGGLGMATGGDVELEKDHKSWLEGTGVGMFGGPVLQAATGHNMGGMGMKLLDLAKGDDKGFAHGSPEGVHLSPEWQTVTDDLEGTHGNYDNGGPKETGVRGRYQYSKRTYKKIAEKLGLDPNKWDKATQDAVHAEYTRQNQRALAAAGVPINNTTTYLGHFLDGPVAAKFYKIVQANPGMDPKEALMRAGYPEKQAENTINWNPRWFKGVNTASDVVERIDHAAARAVQRAKAASQGVGAQVQKYIQGAGNVLQGIGNAGIDTAASFSPLIKMAERQMPSSAPSAPPAPPAPSPMAQIDPASLNKTGYGLGPKPAVFSAPPVAIPTAADIGAPPPEQTGVFPRTFGPKAPEQHGFAWDSFGGSIPSTPRQFLGAEKGEPDLWQGPPWRPEVGKPREYDQFINDTLGRRKYLGDALNPFHTNHDMDITDTDPGTTQVVKGFGQLGEQIVKGVSAPGHALAYVANEASGLIGRGAMNTADWLQYSPEERKRLTSNGLWGGDKAPAKDPASKDMGPTDRGKFLLDALHKKNFEPSPVDALKPRPEAQAAAAQDPQLAKFYSDLEESKADLARQGGNNRAMSLLMAGLGIAGGKSQYFAENLAGAIPAIQNYQQGEREINMARHDLAKEGIAQKQMDRQISQQDVNVQLARDKMAMEKENQTRDNRTALLGEYYRPMSTDDLDRAARTRSADGTTTYDNAISDLQSLDAVRRNQMLKLVEAQMAARAAGAPPPQIPNQLPLQGSSNQPYVLTPTK
jgi:hypothetical protein